MSELCLTAARYPWLSELWEQWNHTKLTSIKTKEIVLLYVHDQGPNPTGLKLSRDVLGNLLCVIIKS